MSTSDKQAAENAMIIMAHFAIDGTFHGADFIAEMDQRALFMGVKLQAKQYATLGKMVRVYCARNNLVRA